jgi:transcriptional regulator with XRE-family HTH domain
MNELANLIGNNLKLLLKKHGLTASSLARAIDLPRPTINRIVSGSTPDPRITTLNSIANYFNITMGQLLGSEPLFIDNDNLTRTVPLISMVNISQLKSDYSNLEDLKGSRTVPIDSSIKEDAFAISFESEAMSPHFKNGTLLIVTNTQVKSRDFVVVYRKEEKRAVFRQILFEGEKRHLKPLNDSFQTFEMNPNDILLGVVKQCISLY